MIGTDLERSAPGIDGGTAVVWPAPHTTTGAPGQGPSSLKPLLSPRQRVTFAALCVCWIATLALFWAWWLRAEHVIDAMRYLANTALLFWSTVVPGYFPLICARARVPSYGVRVPPGLRAAIVVTKAPSEPFHVVRKTLFAAIEQTYPHDTWLADEDPDPETIAWCMKFNVHLCTRKGVTDYHNASWPRRTRCKEGNLAYFYDQFGYDRYEFVAQLDADHVPDETYLEEMLRPFCDPQIGYVSAPSICDANAATSWSARGRLYAEGALHGALQAGHSGGLAPLCIGSHYAVRTAALREIGGLGPELAEDHSTTLMMNAHGWRGVHALNAIAHGDGPATFADMVTQEFQWSKSLMMILLRYTHRYWSGLPPRLKAQFLFAQLWYPLFSVFMAATVVMPALALATGREWVHMSYGMYLAHVVPVTIVMLVTMTWVRSTGCFRPVTAKFVSWESFVFLFARWPWSLLGITSALVDWTRGREFAFRVTPKGKTAQARVPWRMVWPYLLLSLICSVPVACLGHADSASGYYVLSGVNAAVYLLVAIVVAVCHAREQRHKGARSERFDARSALVGAAFIATGVVLAAATALRAGPGMAAILWMPSAIQANAPPPAVGVYDPDHRFDMQTASITIEHTFVSWSDPGVVTQINIAARYALDHHRELMVTVEPWPDRGRNPRTLLRDVNMGAYDDDITRVCSALQAWNVPMFIRWGHEMETVTGRYPWATGQPGEYVDAYRRFVDRCREPAHHLSFVWSPRGDRGLESFFPGQSYVDYIGLSAFSCPSCSSSTFVNRPIEDTVREKIGRIDGFRLPIIIAELGVQGKPDGQHDAMLHLRDTLKEYPYVKAVVYFNAPDSPGAWPWPYRPDWETTLQSLGVLAASAPAEASASH